MRTRGWEESSGFGLTSKFATRLHILIGSGSARGRLSGGGFAGQGLSQSSYRVKVTVRFHLISLTLVQLRFQKDGLRFQSWVHPLFTVAFIDPASNVVRRQHSKRAHSSIQSGPRERAVRVVDLAAEVSEKAAWNEGRHVLIGHAHGDDARGSSKSDRYFHLAYDLGLSADPSGF